MVKLTLCGLPGVGKTTIFNKLIDINNDTPTETTIGSNESRFFIHRDGKVRTVNICDTSGFDRNKTIAQSLYRDCSYVFFVFDQSAPSSFEALSELVHRINDICHDYGKILVCNKTDLEQRVSDEEISRFQTQHEFRFCFRISKNNLDGMRDAFVRFENDVIERYGLEEPHKKNEVNHSNGAEQGISKLSSNGPGYDSCCD